MRNDEGGEERARLSPLRTVDSEKGNFSMDRQEGGQGPIARNEVVASVLERLGFLPWVVRVADCEGDEHVRHSVLQ